MLMKDLFAIVKSEKNGAYKPFKNQLMPHYLTKKNQFLLASTCHRGKLLVHIERYSYMHATRRMAPTNIHLPISCGSSWQKTATDVLRPPGNPLAKAAPGTEERLLKS